MTTATAATKAQLTKQADELAARWILVETNEGTYSNIEAKNAVGTGDPAYANYRIYEQVGTGTRRREGCDPDKAPGRGRSLNRQEMALAQRQLADLRKQIKSIS